MIVPTGDAPNPKGYVAWVNGLLILANVAIYLAITLPLSARTPAADDPQLLAYVAAMAREFSSFDPAHIAASASDYTLFTFTHGFRPAAGTIAGLFSSMFLHEGLAHLAGNMLFLFIYGNNIEQRLGRLGYLLAYVGTGAVATLGYSALVPHSEVVLIGASGAISGVLGHYFVLFPQNRVRLLVLIPFYVRTVFLSARWVLALFLIGDNLLPLLVNAGGNVAHGAHIGGFVAGAVLALVGERLGWGLGGLARGALWFGDPRSPAEISLTTALQRIGAGKHAAAWHHLIECLEAAPDPETRHRALEALHDLEIEHPPHPTFAPALR
jgi:membrane associated rhomboid family serine protease